MLGGGAMDFEPRESWWETFGKRALTVGAIVLCALILFWRSPLNPRHRSLFSPLFNHHTTSLSGPANTLAEAYPFAVKLKNDAMPRAELAMVSAFLKRRGGRFETEMLNFYFVSGEGQ